MKYRVFIHTNHKQLIGALLSAYSLKRNSKRADRFDVELIELKNYPSFAEHEGKLYLRRGAKRRWNNDDLQSFTPLRFMPPEIMGYSGRALVVDPDVFAVGDVYDLLSRDMEGKAIMCRNRWGERAFASSVMLLDCAKLTHWRCEEAFDEMFRFTRDYMDWINLKLEPRESIGRLENQWNDFDNLDENTMLLHNTKRKTQPWKTGLPVDYRPAERSRLFPPLGWINRARRQLFGEYALLGRYKRHPDPEQEAHFFSLLKECLHQGIVNERMLHEEICRKHLRPDALEILARLETGGVRDGHAVSN